MDWINAASHELDWEKSTLHHPGVLYASCHLGTQWTADVTIKTTFTFFNSLFVFSFIRANLCSIILQTGYSKSTVNKM